MSEQSSCTYDYITSGCPFVGADLCVGPQSFGSEGQRLRASSAQRHG